MGLEITEDNIFKGRLKDILQPQDFEVKEWVSMNHCTHFIDLPTLIFSEICTLKKTTSAPYNDSASCLSPTVN